MTVADVAGVAIAALEGIVDVEGVDAAGAAAGIGVGAGAAVVLDRLADIAQSHRHRTAHCGLDTPSHSLLFTRSHGGNMSCESCVVPSLNDRLRMCMACILAPIYPRLSMRDRAKSKQNAEVQTIPPALYTVYLCTRMYVLQFTMPRGNYRSIL